MELEEGRDFIDDEPVITSIDVAEVLEEGKPPAAAGAG